MLVKPLPQHVVIAGGGIAGVTALMALRDLGEHELDIEIIAAQPEFVLRPQLIGGPWGGDPLHVDLAALADEFGARLRAGTLARVAPDHGVVITSAGDEVRFDALLLATGAIASLGYAGVHTIGFGTLPSALSHQRSGTVAVVVPPGVGWSLPAYQLALLAAAAGPVTVVTAEAEPCEVFGPGATPRVAHLLAEHGVEVRTSCIVTPGSEAVRDLADSVFALPLLRGPAIAGLPSVHGGFLPVGEDQRVAGCERVYAAGDITDGPIKQGGLAAQQADRAATEIVIAAGGEPARLAEAPTLRGKLTVGDEHLYLRRELDGTDPGRARGEPMWKPEAAMCAWRLSRWLVQHQAELGADPLGPLAHPGAATRR